ncbi:4-carboxy-4-hydroxy-2-oxoadipate aldolase [Microbacterium faecale]|uniref:Putative 4-hydroxy-4-methyl-2-oxoglutarate aldolase n=1 Tax=Microbacterium faecale TaxID=1804630 RepID=A0A917DDL6_9MICO|nr:dimethylmenaquinone methyltransferase [Microbacterium faecale]GGD29103.1 4-carboxy-4-hydroxy-2-oxoadipate aldolase [Microbacterium faecale]
MSSPQDSRYDLDAIREEIFTLGTATLYEASGMDCLLSPALRPAWPGAALVARALPVTTAAGDNLALHLAIEQARPGEALVVDAQQADHGYWGEVLTAFAQARGVVGLVILGGVRDVRDIAARRFPVFSTSIALAGTSKDDAGEIGAPMRCGHAVIRRGDVIVADHDGVISIPDDAFATVVSRSRERAEQETEYMRQLEDGASSVTLYGFDRDGRR